ncbi:hypothetical protein [Cohnella fermenti]|uniref:DUF2157 domain-containing protein n=1 Tax=Cohnella fermenti TaxID=2565925 RepID=A0A4V3WEB9_9BACL|nr:hypothetical protein [Cohnella fermenti]THF75632.1 hypothetical protein E6C55_21495 [Cohnella fermenti]
MSMLDEEKKKLIVNEIEAWRRGKMLPDHYCDFLQNLYLDDLTDRPKGLVGAAMHRIEGASGRSWFLVFGIFVSLCLIVLHFSVFPLLLQIALIGLGTCGFVVGSAWWRERLPKRAYLLAFLGVLYLVSTGISLLELHGWTGGSGPLLLIGICALVWIACGITLRLGLLHWAGWMAVIALYAGLLWRHTSDPSWGEIQLYWLPASLLFGWLSWFAHAKIKTAGGVLFATALVLWFMPELYSALLGVKGAFMIAEWAVKALLLGVLLYRFRKKWMEWVV